jgi:hypothetical protein
MTKEEIERMQAGRESDDIVGKALGFLHEFAPGKEDGCMICGCVKIHSGHVGYGPRFTTDMNDAMRVVEKIKPREKYYKIFCIRQSECNPAEWEIGMGQIDQYEGFGFDWGKTTTCKYIPLGICKAALMTLIPPAN